MNKHTPGPWRVTDGGVRANGGYIAFTHSVTRYPDQEERYAFEVDQREADKRLIAAAPELLDALEGMLEVYGVYDQHLYREPFSRSVEVELCNQARAAIARAKGESL